MASTFVFFLGGCLQDGIDRTRQGLGGYEPPAPAATTCLWPPDGGHGSVDIDCMNPMCDPGFKDCDGDPLNGCEANLADPSTCGDCSNNCHECRSQATCNAGQCGGRARPNGSACRAYQCSSVGMCHGGSCECGDSGVDMSVAPLPPFKSDRHEPTGVPISGDCSFGGGGTATAGVLLLLGALALLLRRRRPQ